MEDLSAEDTARRLRALWAWSLLSQDEFAEAMGVAPSTASGLLQRRNPRRATVPQLRRAAEAAGVPQWFAEHGFDRPEGTAEDRVAKLEAEFARLSALVDGLSRRSRG